MSNLDRLVAGICLVVGVAVSWSASATTLRWLSVEQLTAKAECIIVGQVVEQASYWEDGRIYTRHLVQVEQELKAPPGPLLWTGYLEVHTLGGIVGGIGQQVAGVAHLPRGENVALFLRQDRHQRFRTVGMWQGMWHTDSLGRLQRPMEHGSHQPATMIGVSESPTLTLDELNVHIQRVSP